LSRATRLRWRASIALPSAPNLRPVLTATARDWSLFWVSAWVISLSGPCSNESVQTAEAKYHAILLFRPYICELIHIIIYKNNNNKKKKFGLMPKRKKKKKSLID